MKVAIIGSGYVGLTTGVCLSFVGHEVTCLDVDPQRVATLRAGAAPFHEPHLGDMLRSVRLRYTTDYAEAIPSAEVIFIAVGTPSRGDGSPNLEYLEAAARSIGEHLGPAYSVVVNKSTVPIGSGNWVESIVRDAFRQKNQGQRPENFAVASNPEFLREGSAIHDSLFPDRVVIGADQQQALERLYSLYRPLLDQSFTPPRFLPRPDGFGAVPLISADLASAELIKYAANAFLALKISYINEIGQLANRVGADVQLVARGMGLDARIGTRFLQAGIGWGGSCFGKDTAALVSTAAEYQLEMPIVQAARKINSRQRELVVERLLGAMKLLKGKTVGLLGLAFKPNTDDLRDAPALDIARKLLERGARVRAHDPVALAAARSLHPDLGVTWCEAAEEVADEADALVLVTDWPDYRELDWAALATRMRHPLILDGRHFLDAARLRALGFQYLAV
ncbi:MAG: UDP-glucose/GDP-mannose dehydrogenase family protein [Bryobacteraceae bacterium]|nr:UDP-glucose/GDP-mannose dehydrogenase family protein [Bryobacteraceae bacterium]